MDRKYLISGGSLSIPYSGKIWWVGGGGGGGGGWGGGVNLAVQEKIAKLNSANIKTGHSGMRARISNAHTYVRYTIDYGGAVPVFQLYM